jgi:hypothetical protein
VGWIGPKSSRSLANADFAGAEVMPGEVARAIENDLLEEKET